MLERDKKLTFASEEDAGNDLRQEGEIGVVEVAQRDAVPLQRPPRSLYGEEQTVRPLLLICGRVWRNRGLLSHHFRQ